LVMVLVKFGASLPQIFMFVALSALVVAILSFKILPQAPLVTLIGGLHPSHLSPQGYGR
jgi:hypothetical protein